MCGVGQIEIIIEFEIDEFEIKVVGR